MKSSPLQYILQSLQSEHTDSIKSISKTETSNQSQFVGYIGAEQHSLSVTRTAITDSLSSVSCDLDARNAEVKKFVTEEIARDVPTG